MRPIATAARSSLRSCFSMAALIAAQVCLAQPFAWNWSKVHDDGAIEYVSGMVTEPATGNIYITGTYDHTSLLDLQPGPFGLNSVAGGTDAFIVKLSPSGDVIWKNRLGGNSTDVSNGIAIAPNGNIYITGGFTGTLSSGLISSILAILSSSGNMDMFVACYDPSGNLLWLERGGSTDADRGVSIAANSTGVFVQGIFRREATFGTTSVMPPTIGNDHLFLAKYPLSGGSPIWVRQGVNAQDNIAGGLAADEDGAYATGSFKGTTLSWNTAANVPVSTITCNNTGNIHITRFTNSGDVSWIVAIDAPGTANAGNAIAVGCGRIFISGMVDATAIFPGNMAIPGSQSEEKAMFIAALNKTNGNTQWIRSAKTSNNETAGTALQIGANKALYVTGHFKNSMTLDDGTLLAGQNDQEYFVARLTPFGDWSWVEFGSAAGDQRPLALATHTGGKVYIGGVFRSQIRFGTTLHSHGNDLNLFVAQASDTFSGDPSDWIAPTAICSSSAPLDMNVQLGAGSEPNGTWSGTAITPQGIFDPSGVTGMIPITYSLESGPCAFSTTRSVSVVAPASATIQGPSIVCPGSPQVTLSLTALPPLATINGWQKSVDGIVWTDITGTSANTLSIAVTEDCSYRASLNSPACGNAMTAAHALDLKDPVLIVCPSDTTVIADPITCAAQLEYELKVDDDCGTPAIACSHMSGTSFPLGMTTVEITATANAEVATCSFNVNVIDQQPPQIACSPNIIQSATAGQCGRIVHFNATTADCSTATLSYSHPSGTFFPLGTTTVAITATDGSGLTSTCMFTITINDNDTDGDGSGDCNDGCPLDPLKTRPGVCGCGNPDTDADNNGFPDCIGACAQKFYFNAVGNGNDIPKALLKTDPPVRPNLGNYDPSTDSAPGRTIKKGGNGFLESSTDRFQIWSIPFTSMDGNVALRFWSAIKDMNTEKGGMLRIYLADCNATAGDCDLLASVLISRADWHGNASQWIEENISFGYIDHTFAQGRTLAVKMVVDNDSEDDIWIAYDAVPFPAALTIGSDQDSDGDGVADCMDQCPADPEKQAPGNCGCGEPEPGSSCDDNDAATINDRIQNDCSCAGDPLDCAGVPNGSASIDNCGNCVGGNTGNIACVQDCNGVWGGSASIDNCGNCVGGNTGNVACIQDCNGVWGGSASIDNCGNCVGGNTGNIACIQDCNGDWGGSASIDNCGTCVGGNTGNVACVQDCNGVWGGSASIDNCGTCVGGNTGNIACIQDCNGDWGGSASIDNCGNCVGGNTGNVACIQDCNGDWGGSQHAGSLCDDLDPCTVNDVYQADCSCAGTPSVPDPTFYFAADQFCANSFDPSPYIATFGGTFQTGQGLIIDHSTGTIDLSGSEPGDHMVEYQIGGSCPASSNVLITIVPPPASEWIAPQQVCNNSVPIDLDGSLSAGTSTDGTWSGPGIQNGLFDPTGLYGGIAIGYSVTANACTSTTIHMIDVAAAPVAFAGQPASICGNAIEMNASTDGNGTWILPEGLWADAPGSPNATISTTLFGTYEVTWSATANGCTEQHSTMITFMDPAIGLWADAGPDQRTISASAELIGNTLPGTITSWSLIEGEGTITDPSSLSTAVHGLAIGTNRFLFTARSGSCAIATDTVTVIVDDFFIPAGFSPNNDGVNDLFVITGLGNFPQSALQIYNRWGQEVMRSDDYRNDWDGRSANGTDLPNDTYFYVLNLGDGRTYNGYVIVKR